MAGSGSDSESVRSNVFEKVISWATITTIGSFVYFVIDTWDHQREDEFRFKEVSNQLLRADNEITSIVQEMDRRFDIVNKPIEGLDPWHVLRYSVLEIDDLKKSAVIMRAEIAALQTLIKDQRACTNEREAAIPVKINGKEVDNAL